jgi:hypothetical protein
MGLLAHREMAGARKFVVRPKPMGPPSGFSSDNVEELLDSLDGGKTGCNAPPQLANPSIFW